VQISTITDSLSSRYAATDEVAVAWWDREWFERMLDQKLSDEQWDAVLLAAEKVLEFSNLGDWMTDAAADTIYELERRRMTDKKPRKKRSK